MSKPTVPGPDGILQELEPVLSHLYPAIDHGVFKANTYFDDEQLPVDPLVHASLVRLHAKHYLLKSEILGIAFDELAMCGVSFTYPGFHIRVWKAQDHELPSPGYSQQRLDFYNFNEQSCFDFVQNEASLLKLALLWSLSNDRKLIELWLACPRNWDEDEQAASYYWRTRIPDPTTSIKVEVQTPSKADLPIERLRPNAQKKKG